MKVIFSKLALLELNDAIRFYECEYKGLGKRFKKEIKNSAIRVSDYPKAWSIERGEIRKCILHKFPYKLLYSIEKDHIFVVAVAHLHRKPDYWIEKDINNKYN